MMTRLGCWRHFGFGDFCRSNYDNIMKDQSDTRDSGKDRRTDRLNDALRQNLRKRKKLTRELAEANDTDGEGDAGKLRARGDVIGSRSQPKLKRPG